MAQEVLPQQQQEENSRVSSPAQTSDKSNSRELLSLDTKSEGQESIATTTTNKPGTVTNTGTEADKYESIATNPGNMFNTTRMYWDAIKGDIVSVKCSERSTNTKDIKKIKSLATEGFPQVSLPKCTRMTRLKRNVLPVIVSKKFVCVLTIESKDLCR